MESLLGLGATKLEQAAGFSEQCICALRAQTWHAFVTHGVPRPGTG
jgi:hypothetical protein